ncbi:hypothetical protein M2390_002457 [Mycetocola sp. BIGb0189]|uniref:ATP-binding protein n=1 Tax=Mycetocola sp. BIGb0189 TaxID=2940604 RepID=UPI0021693182|nr:AAA family ATPase [Mycetocola sp. BIGb0189]MCS4277253.1 hypothetical protein [Mycetocola sp. BIGb0189]
MDEATDEQYTSPFSPGYGKQPLVFGGHEREIVELTDVFDSLDFGENHSVLLSGLRGAGKTSMLSLLQNAAADRGWLVISEDASRGLMKRVMNSTIPTLIGGLESSTKARLTGFNLWKFGANWEYEDRAREAVPQLRNDLVALSAARDGRGILITIDEVSSGKVRLRELSEFAVQVSHALNDGANIMIVFAGIKVDIDELIKQEHTTFLRRSRDLDFRRLSPSETRRVLAETSELGGRRIEPAALELLVSISQGYPYLVQLAGDYAWRNNQTARIITLPDAKVALDRAIRAVQSRVISKVYLDLSDQDREFLAAMAVDEGRTRTADIRDRMQVSDQYVQIYRRRLIDSGYVQPDGHGYVRFSLPYLDRYIRTVVGITPDPEDDVPDEWAHYPAPEL